MADNGEIFGSVVEAVSGLVFVHCDVQDPMEAVFHCPMRADNLTEALGGQGVLSR